MIKNQKVVIKQSAVKDRANDKKIVIRKHKDRNEVITTQEEKKNVLIQKIFYINLDNRKDRKSEILTELMKYQEKCDYHINIERFAAIPHDPGYIGASMSHLIVLQKCLQDSRTLNIPYFVIFEDDFQWKMDPLDVKTSLEILASSNVKWDVILFTASKWSFTTGESILKTPIGEFYKITSSSTATGYIIKSTYIPELVGNIQSSLNELINGGLYKIFALDQYWSILQKRDNWLFHIPGFGRQKPGYSDIEKKETSYSFN